MSFPKARLLRFNEVSTCAPPPGKYDPKYDEKIKGTVIEKSKRFVDPKFEAAPSVTSHDSVSACSHNYNPAATFRTPQLPRKTRLVSTPRSAIERPTTRTQQKQATPECKSRKKLDLGYETEQNLIEQINELTRVHTLQLLDKDQELANLQREMAALRGEMSKIEKNHVVDHNTMKQSYEKALEKMKCELEELAQSAEEEKGRTEGLIVELKNKVAVLQENVNNSNAICNDLEYQLAEANISMVEVRNEYADLEKQLKQAKGIINEMIKSKTIENEWFVNCFPQHLEEVFAAAEKKNINDLTSKMKERLKNLERELEIERMETHKGFAGVIDTLADDVKDRVELFEQNSTLLQARIKSMSEGFEGKINDLVCSIARSADINDQKLQENLRLTEELEKARAGNVEKKIVVVDLQNRIEELQDRLAHLTNHCRKYEIVQAEATKTIHVLSQRLFESETEVERLNDQTEELTLRKDALEGKVKSVVDENNVLKIEINDLQASLVRDVKEVEVALLAKVETYRRHTVEETQKLKNELDAKQVIVDMQMNEVEYHRAKAAESSEYINMCQTRIASYKQEVAAMSEQLAALEDDYNDKLGAQKALLVESTTQLEAAKMDASRIASELAAVKSTNDELSADLLAARASLAEAEARIASLSDEISELRHESDTVKDQVANLETEIDLKKSLLVKVTSEIEALRDQLAKNDISSQQMAEKVERMSESNAKASQIITSLSTENEDLTSNMKELTENIVEKDLRLGSLTQELEEAKLYNRNLTSRIASLANELAAKESQFDELAQEVEVKNMTMVQVSDEYEKMKTMYENECRRSEVVEQDNITTIALMEADLRLEQSHNQELEESLKRAEAKLSEAEQTLERRTEELCVAKNGKSTLEFRIIELEGQVYKAEEDRKALTKEKEDLMELVNRQWEERGMLTNQIASQQEEIVELKQMRDDRFEEEKAIYQAELQNEIFALQQSLEDTQKHAIDLQGSNEELVFKLNSAESELNAAEAHRERQETATKDLEEKVSSLEHRCSSAEKRKNEYKKYATQLESEKKVLVEQVGELNEEKEKLLDEKREVSMQLTSTSASLADQEIRAREAETRCRELETMVEPFQEQLVAYEKERAALLAKSAMTEKELEDLTKEHAKALGHQNLRQKIHRVQQLTEANSKFKQENEKLLSENAKLRTALLAHQDGVVKRAAKAKTFKDATDKENDASKIGATPRHAPQSPFKVRNS